MQNPTWFFRVSLVIFQTFRNIKIFVLKPLNDVLEFPEFQLYQNNQEPSTEFVP